MKPEKPLGQKAYGSIPHLPGSRRGPSDYGLSDQQAALLTVKTRDRRDLVTVQEKLDGSCVSVAKINGACVPLIRAGYPAEGSHYTQHHYFAAWALNELARFDSLLEDGERCVGEWLMEAHGTIYTLHHEPFVIFDIMRGHARLSADEVNERCERNGFTTPRLLHQGAAIDVASVLALLEPSGHGAQGLAEGAVWRMERSGKVDFLGKYVRPEKIDGQYLENVSGKPAIYNWQP